MLNLMNIETREATLNCHDVLAPNSSGLNLFLLKEIRILAIINHRNRKKIF